MIRFIVSILLVPVVFVAAIVLGGGKMADFFSAPALLVVGLIPVLGCTAVFSLTEVARSFFDPFRRKKNAAKSEDVCKLYERLVLLTGLLATIIALAIALGNAADFTKIGKNLAMGLLPLAYGISFDLLSRIWRERLKSKD
jgi:flagellar motor component MotA